MAGHGAIEGAARARRGPVRERIFEAACALFYEHGIHQVGVDAIATAAGTNKMSFYRSFASKDALVALYLRQRERALWQWWDQAIAAHARAPRRQIEALFAELVRHCRGQASWGCAVANAAAEIRDPSHPAIAVIHTQKAELQRRFRALARAAGARPHPFVVLSGSVLEVPQPRRVRHQPR